MMRPAQWIKFFRKNFLKIFKIFSQKYLTKPFARVIIKVQKGRGTRSGRYPLKKSPVERCVLPQKEHNPFVKKFLTK